MIKDGKVYASCMYLLIQVISGRVLSPYLHFPFPGGERLFGSKAKAGRRVDDYLVEINKIGFACFHTAHGNADARQVAH